MSFYKEDNWQSAIIHAPMKEIISDYGFGGCKVTLLPSEDDGCVLSDPFGLWRGDRLFIFVKAYNKHSFRSTIRVLVYDSAFTLLETAPALEEEWNLGYPQLFEHDGGIYMLPEAHASGRLSLYRAVNFPTEWEKVQGFEFPLSVVRGTMFYHAHRWWLFWSPADSVRRKEDTLHIAVAEELTGVWADMGPFLTDRGGAVPGGTPLVTEGTVFLPVVQNRRTMGGGLRLLRFESFGGSKPLLVGGRSLDFPPSLATSYPDGMHTLSEAGPVSLIDVKKEILSLDKPINLAKDLLRSGSRILTEAARLVSDR
ncbi:hypothetical protein PT277_05705 [Acetobacteraceae bacterium ESL0709]|nr:hypothetical protein [Acetobacteraceae bacterium ESL0697]MDF7678192.1 hypothetical protein [Acetobacteraceae bacterium ESL0709]